MKKTTTTEYLQCITANLSLLESLDCLEGLQAPENFYVGKE